MKAIPKKIRFKVQKILNIELLFVIENSIKLQKMVLEGKTIIL
jgi:hypothetical protein